MEFMREFERRMKGKYDSQTRARLKTVGLQRLNNLINKDFVMFDTIQTVSIEDILEKPTVIELDSIGDDEQKSLVTTLLLNNLRSYIRSNKDDFTSGKLNSLILLEEAHVIFSAPIIGETRTASNAIAISLIEGILKELRSLGVGMIIADQSPQAVSAEVIKMTEHKMAFRTVESTDREVLAGAMAMSVAMDDNMKEKLAMLPVGCGFFFNGLTGTPELLQTPNFRQIMNVPVTISTGEVISNNDYWDRNDNRPYLECIDCNICDRKCIYKIRDEGRFIASSIISDYFYSDKYDEKALKKVLGNYIDISMSYVNKDFNEEEKDISIKCALVKLLRDLYLKYDIKLPFESRVAMWKLVLNKK